MKTSNSIQAPALLIAFAIGFSSLLLTQGLGAQDVRTQNIRNQDVRALETPSWLQEFRAQNPEAFTFRRAWKQKVRRIRAFRALMPQFGPALSPSDLARGGAAVTGTLNVPIVGGLYSGATAMYQPADYQQRLFGDGSGTVSARDLYLEMSGGVFSVEGAVADWVSLPEGRAYYEPSEESHSTIGRTLDFIDDVLGTTDATFDFSQFDNDGPDGVPNSGDDDGFVDVLGVIYQAIPITCTGVGTGIWPHRWNYPDLHDFYRGTEAYYVTNDAAAGGGFIRIMDYVIQGGIQCDGASVMGAGTLSHELGHALDLPDLYDTNDDVGGDSQGIGHWGLMGSGNWNIQTSPAHMSAWSKDFLGWLTIVGQTGSTDIQLDPIIGSQIAHRINIPFTQEYFLLENRQPTGSDEFLHGHGMVIMHIDPARAKGLTEDDNNTVNAVRDHKGVDVEEADGNDDLDFMEPFNRGDAGDPFPGSSNTAEFHDRTYPSSRGYNDSPCQVKITNIRETVPVVFYDLDIVDRAGIYGDADGNGVVEWGDLGPVFWYHLGLRDPSSQAYIDNGDVNVDGVVDLLDAFILHSHIDGQPLPDNQIGELSSAPCVLAPPVGAAPSDVLPGIMKRRGGGR